MQIISKESAGSNAVSVEFTITPEELDKYAQKVYLRMKKNITIPGFRKGKAPRAAIENHYGGPAVFYEDAAEQAFKDSVMEILANFEKKTVGTSDSTLIDLSPETGAKFKVTVITYPEVILEKYKGFEVEEYDETVSEDDLQKALKEKQMQYSTLKTVERDDIQNGDILDLDYEGFIPDIDNGGIESDREDGKIPFDGGRRDDAELEIGSGNFIPGFEEALIGHKRGEEFEIDVTFPADYHAEKLRGVVATFRCNIKEIRERILPELDDEFVLDFSTFETLEEYKQSLREKIAESKKNGAEEYYSNFADTAVIEQLQADIPQALFEEQIDRHVDMWREQSRKRGLTLENYIRSIKGMTYDLFRDFFRSQADREVKLRLALEKIAELENFEVTPEETENQIAEVSKAIGVDVDILRKGLKEEDVVSDAKVEKARKFVRDNIIIVPKKV